MGTFADITDVPDNVREFVEKVFLIIGDFEAGLFKSRCDQHFCCYLDDSPIEQLLFISLSAVSHYWNAFFTPKIKIISQKEIGKYRVDFFVLYGNSDDDDAEEKSIIVECDSQQFHERSEDERRYEKKRDRFLQREGYNIHHYTGKEIIEDPFKVAHEIVKDLVGEAWGGYEIIKIDVR